MYLQKIYTSQHLILLGFLLQKLYYFLDEPDGVSGIAAKKETAPTIQDQILAYESIGSLSDASVCYDLAIQSNPNDLDLYKGLLKCRLALGETSSALEQVDGLISERFVEYMHSLIFFK